jgi:hypothetical protein
MEPMKNKNHDELDGDQSIFAASRCCDNRAISKTTPFADISERVGDFFGVLTQGSSCLATLGWMMAIPLGFRRRRICTSNRPDLRRWLAAAA